jgi:hypothetical protein
MLAATTYVSPGAGFPVARADSAFTLGIDLGQKQDFTALAIIEREHRVYSARNPATYAFYEDTLFRLRHVERIKLGTPYPEIVDAVDALIQTAELKGRCRLVVDATGVGLPVMQMLKERCRSARVEAVTITGGARASSEGGMHRVPKRDLVTALQLAFERKQIAISGSLPLIKEVIHELMTLSVKVGDSGRERFEAWRESDHDDLVLAIALAWWRASRREPEFWGQHRLL